MVRLTGAEVRRFCNGMFTNNARDLPIGQGQRTAMLDDRGRLQGVFDLFCVADDTFVCALEGVTADAFIERYGMYMMLDDVEHETLDWQVATVQGGSVPGWSGCSHPRDRSGLGGFDLVGPGAPLTEVLAATGLSTLDSASIDAVRIRAGRPRWPVDMGAKQLPHELGMRDEFLHFEKGCYLGQETINRVDVMGQVRKALCGVRIEGDELPPTGAEVRSDTGQKVGRLTSPLATADLGNIGLSVIKTPWDAPGTPLVVVDGERTWQASASALPFS